MTRQRHSLSIVCGLPGTGKTTVAKRLAAEQGACLLDSDNVAERLIRVGLQAAGLDPNDRDSPLYKERYRREVYETLFEIAEWNLDHTAVVIAGPFTSEIRSATFVDELMARFRTSVSLYFVQASPEIRRKRLAARGESRDFAKLADWENYLSTFSEQAPECPHICIENNAD